MTAIELLPLPRPSFDYPYAYDGDDMENYALANIAHTTAQLQAEVEALRAEVVKLRNMRNDMNNAQSTSQKVVAWARPVYARPVNAPDTGEWDELVDIEFHTRPEKPEGEGWYPLVVADTGRQSTHAPGCWGWARDIYHV